MQRLVILFVVLLGAFHSPAWAQCFTVYNPAGWVIYRGPTTPVDLSGSISQAMRTRFPGGQLVIEDTAPRCTPIDPGYPVNPRTGAAASAPGSERAGLSVVSGPRANAPVNVTDSGAQGPSVDEGCRMGNAVSRR